MRLLWGWHRYTAAHMVIESGRIQVEQKTHGLVSDRHFLVVLVFIYERGFVPSYESY